MGLRETYGGMIEAALNELVDKHLDATKLKEELHSVVDKYVDEYLEDLKHKLKADLIDKIDGEDDIK